MEDSSNVRLVKCPKCENLLPELADYAVYQCGGCGAVLRAKEQAVRGNSDNSECSVDSRAVDSGGDLNDDTNSNSGFNSRQLRKEGGREIFRNHSQVVGENGLTKNTIYMDGNSKQLGKLIGREGEEVDSQIASFLGSKTSDRTFHRQNREKGEMDVFERNFRTGSKDVSKSTNEGPSNYFSNSYRSYGDMWRQHKDHGVATRVQYLEQDRAELLRKLDEIKDQLSWSCNVVDKPKERLPSNERMLPTHSYGTSDARSPSVSAGLKRGQFFGPDKHASGSSYTNNHSDPLSCVNNYGTSMHNIPAYMHSNYAYEYLNPFGSQMLRRASHGLPYQFPQETIHTYFSGKYPINSDPFEPYTHNRLLHYPSCSCFRCCDVKHKGSVPVPPANFDHRRFNVASRNSPLYCHEFPDKFDPYTHNSKTYIPPATFQETAYTRWPSDQKPDLGRLARNNRQEAVLAGGGRHFRPVAGGAPFFTCNNCFDLLQIPEKALTVRSHLQKVQCGACSTVMTFSMLNGKLVLSHYSELKGILTEVVNSSDEIVENSVIHSHSHNWSGDGPNFSSDDYDNSGYDFQSINKEPTSLTTDGDSSNRKEMQYLHSSSPSTSDDENSHEVLVTSREVISSVPRPIQAVPSPAPSGLPIDEYLNYSADDHVINRFGKGSHSSRSEQGKGKTNKAISRQNSLTEATLATELDVPFNDYSNNDDSQESTVAGRDDDQPRANKAGESFFANIIKKSFRDFIRSNQLNENGKGSTIINGQIIPDRVVKMAEKLAGPIHPGKYWYDVRAGFWGVMGGPCLGIIPPFIEVFNYPMPANCCGGNTGVFVNGRELHKKDLELLSRRGLPFNGGRYIIDISGRVFDEETSEELDNLGKLAPTVQQVKRGFGMKPPKVAEQH